MSIEDNKLLVRRLFEEFVNEANEATADEVIHPDTIDHSASSQTPAGRAPGVEGVKQFFVHFRKSFPHLQSTIEDIIAEGDRVAIRYTAHTKHEGDYLGIPATNKEVTLTGIAIYRVADGQLAEAWLESNALGLLQQLGALPTMP